MRSSKALYSCACATDAMRLAMSCDDHCVYVLEATVILKAHDTRHMELAVNYLQWTTTQRTVVSRNSPERFFLNVSTLQQERRLMIRKEHINGVK